MLKSSVNEELHQGLLLGESSVLFVPVHEGAGRSGIGGVGEKSGTIRKR